MSVAAIGPRQLLEGSATEVRTADIAATEPIVTPIEERAPRFDLVERPAQLLVGPQARLATADDGVDALLGRLAGEHLREQRREHEAAIEQGAPPADAGGVVEPEDA